MQRGASMTTTIRRGVLIAVAAIGVAACTGRRETALGNETAARSLSADLLVRFTKSADAGNRAVMAVTDEASTSSAREAEGANRAPAAGVRPVFRRVPNVELGLLTS